MGRMRRGQSTGTEEVPTDGPPGRRLDLSIARPRTWRQLVLLIAAVPSLALLGGCSGDNDRRAAADESDDTTTTAAETSSTLSAREQEEQAVIQAHEAATQARIDSAAAPSPDPADPVVAETHTGLMLERWTGTLTALQHNGFAIRYPANSQNRSEVESVTFDEVDGQEVAYVEVCAVDDGERFAMATDAVLSSGVRTTQVTEALRKEGGGWKVAELRENQRWDGVAGCAVD